MKIGEKAQWNELLTGGVIEDPGNSVDYKTGPWRTERPIWNKDACINCMFCWVYCPDSAIKVDKDGNMAGINYDFCKGCGICVKECPKPNTLAMALEVDIEKKGMDTVFKETFGGK